MNLVTLLQVFSDRNCRKVYVKRLSANDNSKNQVYLGGSFDILNILPLKEITTDTQGNRKRESFKSKLDFFWLTNDAELAFAPHTQLILYPDYPEVRLSGFLLGCKSAPSELMRSRIVNRLLFLGLTDNGEIIGYVVEPDSEIYNEFSALKDVPTFGVFSELTLEKGTIELNTKGKLLIELKRIHHLGWIDAKRLDKYKKVVPCPASNCGGYTLEAELGITPNGYAEPDYLGWEVKQFGVKNFNKYNSEVITLMTPEPTHGYYVEKGVEEFIHKYGYVDKKGREARLNFGGIHKYNIEHATTTLKMVIYGYDSTTGKIINADGYIALIDKNEDIAASWSFPSLLQHWNTKHANACYIPSMNRKDANLYSYSRQQYCYGNNILLGKGTDFSLVLKQIEDGNLFYDPGIKLEQAIEGLRKQNTKRRSQFRIKSANLVSLYKNHETINLVNQSI